MGKKEEVVIKKGVALFILSVFLFIGGCETVKGAFEGAKRDWKSAQKVDDWMQENLW